VLRRAAAPAIAGLLAGLLAASGAPPAPSAVRAEPAAVAAPAATPDTSCDPTRSVRASTSDGGPKVSEIMRRGYLVAGVDQNSYHWGFRDTRTGQFEGFDIDLVRAIAKALFGDENKVQFKSVSAANRIQALQQHQVDLVLRATAITCERMTQVAFSTVYFQTGHQALVAKSSPARTLDEALRGKRGCVAAGATEQAEIQSDAHGAQVRTVENEVDCLVLLQLGEVEAIFTDTAYGSALAAQDPLIRLVDKPYGTKLFGVAMNLADTDLVARVNAVLEDYRKGPWQDSYNRWLAPYLGPAAGPPAAAYLP
jgi:polar amino acid transport system substrate-binding protein